MEKEARGGQWHERAAKGGGRAAQCRWWCHAACTSKHVPGRLSRRPMAPDGSGLAASGQPGTEGSRMSVGHGSGREAPPAARWAR
eukprot:364282-Chlamydomonas_euryale.AAC.1